MLSLARHALFVAGFAVICSLLSPARAQQTVQASVPSTPGASGAAFSVVENDRFGASVTGLPGAIAVEASADAKTQAAARALAIESTRITPAARERVTRQLRAIGALGPGTPLRRPRILAYTRSGALPTRDFSAAAAKIKARDSVAPLRFKFTGFPDSPVGDTDTFYTDVYPLMTALYGDPALAQQNRTVEIRYDTTAGDGLYELPASGQTTSGGVIHYDPILPDNTLSVSDAHELNEYNLVRQMLIAFHGAQVISFDAWELGMSDAAALIVASQLHPSSSFDPSLLGVYLLPIYDILNRPELGNPYFFSTGSSPNLGYFRAGMAQAAWLKVWVDNHNVFKLFNAAYYTAYAQNGAGLAGNTATLKSLVAQIQPTVEGLQFNDWYRRQMVLDTSITAGEKLWLAVVPQPNLTSGDTRSVFLGIAQRYTTAADGNEVPVSGTATIRAYAETGADVTLYSDELNSDNTVIFNSLGEAELNGQNVPTNETPIVGFDGTGTPEQGRFRIVVTMQPLQSEAVFPYGVAGTITNPSGFYGAIVNNRTGNLTIATTGRTATVAVARGAFADAGLYPSGSGVVTTFTLAPTDGSAPNVWKRNGMWSYSGGRSQSFGVILETAPGNLVYTHTYSNSADNHWRLMSLPLYPTLTDEADVLGVSRASLSLGRYRSNTTTAGFSTGGIAFDITTDRHQMYPNIDTPFAPGRGYWLKLDTNLSSTVKGGEPSRTTNFEVPLVGGWNTVGTPFDKSISLSALRVSYLGTTVAFADAVANGWIGAGIWRWKPEGGYARVDNYESTSQTLNSYEGYYIWSRYARGVSLIFDPKSTSTTSLPHPALTAANWRLPFTVSSPSATDDGGAWGVTTWTDGTPITRAAARPPGGPRSLTFAFLSSGNATANATGAGNASGWAECLQAPSATLTARALVDGAANGQTVTIAWGDLAALPVSIDATFIDEATGAKTDMGPTRLYRFVSDGKAHLFRIESKPRAAGILALTAADTNGSRAVEINAGFGTAGRASLDIEKTSGDLVRNVTVAESVTPGVRKWTWNGTDSAGRQMPGGTYVAHLRMTDDRGVESEKSVTFVLGALPDDPGFPGILGLKVTQMDGTRSIAITTTYAGPSDATLNIEKPDGTVVCNLVSESVVRGSKTQYWDGTDAGKTALAGGSYAVHLTVVDANNVTSQKSVAFELEALPPAGILGFKAVPLDGLRTVAISVTYGGPGNATLNIEKPDGTVVRNLVAEAVVRGSKTLYWDGTDGAKAPVAGGPYVARLRVTDSNQFASEQSAGFTLPSLPTPGGILGLKAQPLDGLRTVAITATYAGPGTATLNIEKPNGAIVSYLVSESVVRGSKTQYWDGTDAGKLAAPGGNYVAHLRVVDNNRVISNQSVTFALPAVPTLAIMALKATPLDGLRTVAITTTYGGPGTATLTIEKLNGTLVRTLVTESVVRGSKTQYWDGTDAGKTAISGGAYLAHLRVVDVDNVATDKSVGFTLEALPDPGAILNLKAQQLDGLRTVAITTTYAGPGTATLSIRKPDGTIVRSVVTESVVRGSKTQYWDGADGSKTPVPLGTYVAYLRVLDNNNVAWERSVTLVLK